MRLTFWNPVLCVPNSLICGEDPALSEFASASQYPMSNSIKGEEHLHRLRYWLNKPTSICRKGGLLQTKTTLNNFMV